MTICRYYVQGYCRFGDRCRFEHISKDDVSYNSYSGHQNEHSRQYRSENTYQQDYRYGGQQYRYDERYRTESPGRYSSGSYSNDRQYRYDRNSDYPNHDTPRYQNKGYGSGSYSNEYQRNYSSNQYTTNARYDAHEQNKYKWSNDDYGKQGQDTYLSDTNVDFNTSTPKGRKSSFSFKVPESEIKKSSHVLTQQDQLSIQILKEDCKSWELGGIWPFTCYFPIPNKPGYPGFSDVSPEELRYAAYKAEKNNTFQSYTQAVQDALTKINHRLSELQISTPQLIDTLRRIWKGENLCSTDAQVSIPYLKYEETSMETAPSVFSAKNTSAAFSFKTVSETDSSVKSAAASFSFKQPSDTKSAAASFSFKQPSDTKSAAAEFSFKQPTETKPSESHEIYTPLENLTDEEKEQFMASTFVLGKIPTKPPPQILCV